MQFVDIPFPERIAFGAQSDVTWATELAATQSGHEITNQSWEENRHVFDVSFAVRLRSDYLQVRSHFNQTRGRAKSFPFKDFLDYQVSTSEGKLLSSAGAAPAGNGTYYLHKRYGTGSDAYDRRITRPDSPAQVFRTRSGSTTNITGAGAVVTHTTGAVAITGHAGGDTYSWSGTFKVPCRYEADRLPAVAVNKEGTPDGDLWVECGAINLIEVRE